jgi:hypothetical protein
MKKQAVSIEAAMAMMAFFAPRRALSLMNWALR